MRWPFRRAGPSSTTAGAQVRFELPSRAGLLVVHCAPALRPQAEGLLQIIRDDCAGIRDGYKLQFGWMVLNLAQRGREFVLQEPDFGGDPYKDFRDDITSTFMVQAQQLAILQRLGITQPDIPLYDHTLLCSKSCLDLQSRELREPRIYLERQDRTQATDSGWYIGPADRDIPEQETQDPESYQVLPIWHLLRLRPELLPLVALPFGYLAVIRGREIELIFNGEGHNVWVPASTQVQRRDALTVAAPDGVAGDYVVATAGELGVRPRERKER